MAGPQDLRRLVAHAVRAAALLAITLASHSCARSDDNIERDVRSRLIVDDATLGMKVTVTAERGSVRLSGVARTRRQYERALAIAGEVVGADKVVNEVRLDEHPLATAVYEAVRRDPSVAEVPLEIEAVGFGVVVLRSDRTTEAQRTRLLEIAGTVPGVERVDAYMK